MLKRGPVCYFANLKETRMDMEAGFGIPDFNDKYTIIAMILKTYIDYENGSPTFTFIRKKPTERITHIFYRRKKMGEYTNKLNGLQL